MLLLLQFAAFFEIRLVEQPPFDFENQPALLVADFNIFPLQCPGILADRRQRGDRFLFITISGQPAFHNIKNPVQPAAFSMRTAFDFPAENRTFFITEDPRHNVINATENAFVLFGKKLDEFPFFQMPPGNQNLIPFVVANQLESLRFAGLQIQIFPVVCRNIL